MRGRALREENRNKRSLLSVKRRWNQVN
jgi:hypothetical protein